jgi:hypothetical protein
MKITTTILFPSGALELSAMVNGYLVRKTYYDFTRKEAVAYFRQFIRTAK